MASIVERTRKDGSKTYLAQIIRRNPKHQESRSFPTRKSAEVWARKREKEIDLAVAEGRPLAKQADQGKTLGDVITAYVTDTMRPPGKTKAQVLRTILNEYDIAKMRCDRIKSVDIINFAKELHKRPGVTSGVTVGNYLSHLSSIFKVAKPLYGAPLDHNEMLSAIIVCREMGFTRTSGKRTRRPTMDEMNRIMEHFAEKHRRYPQSAPMHRIVAFAMFSSRRLSEITRLRWEDYDRKNKRILVRDLKHPTEKEGNHQYVELPDPCCAIIDAMPKSRRYPERIFAFGEDAISAAFTRACKFLEIEDLTFHDLRHEAASRLFEMGRTIPLAAAVTGHRSWGSLQRYTHIIACGDKWEGWPWIKKVT